MVTRTRSAPDGTIAAGDAPSFERVATACCPLEPPRSPVSPVPVPPPPNRPQPPPLRCRKLATSSAPAIAPSVRRTFGAGQGTGFLNQYLPANQTRNDVSSAPTTAP